MVYSTKKINKKQFFAKNKGKEREREKRERERERERERKEMRLNTVIDRLNIIELGMV